MALQHRHYTPFLAAFITMATGLGSALALSILLPPAPLPYSHSKKDPYPPPRARDLSDALVLLLTLARRTDPGPKATLGRIASLR